MKKFLSLVLALVMTMSLVTISAGAKDFTDDDKITYEEAVAVVSEIGVVDGYADGKFNPTNTLTRQAAAKIICNLILGPTTAAELHADTAPYKDVPATSEFAGYIAYCAKEGIISGYADGTFKPGNTLTGYAFMKMLLGALGYDASIEGYTGGNWSINVAKQAIAIGLNKSLVGEFNGIKAVTREEACLYAFNTLQADMVEYDTTISTTINGQTVTIGNSLAKAQKWNNSATRINNIKADEYIQFAEQYFPKLEKKADTDEFMRPAYTWTYNKAEIGTYVDKDLLVESYTTGVSGKTIYELLGSVAIRDNRLESYVDGVEGSIVKDNLTRRNTKDLADTDTGVLTEVYLDTDKEVITIVSINTYLAQATADYSKSKEYAPLAVYVSSGKNATTYNVDVVDVEEVESVEKDGWYLVNISKKDTQKGEVVAIQDAEVLEDSTVTKFSRKEVKDDNGTITNRYVTKLTTGGTQYSKAAMALYDEDTLNKYNESLLTDITYNVYLDQYGNFIGVDVYSGTANYVFITGYDLSKSNLAVTTAKAAAIFLDGTMDEITVNVKDTNSNIDKMSNTHNTQSLYKKWEGNEDNGKFSLNRWYTYTKSESGVYTLKPAERVTFTNYDTGAVIDTANLDVKGDVVNTARVYGEDDTVFLTVEEDVVDTTNGRKYAITDVTGVYTGVQSVDLEIVASNYPYGSEVYTVYDSDYFIIGAIVLGEAKGNTANLAYILSGANSEEKIGDTYYWEFDVVMGGEVKTVTAKSKYLSTIQKLTEGFVQELRFDGDYVVSIKDVPTDGDTGDKTYTTNDLKDPNNKLVKGNDVYFVEVKATDAHYAGELNLKGRTMYVTAGKEDIGVALAADAKAVVIQNENNKKDVKTEFDSVSGALGHLADASEDDGLQYTGKIIAVLNSKGAAEWVVFDNGTDLLTGSDKPIAPSSSDIRVVEVDEAQHYVWLNKNDQSKANETNVKAAVNQALFDAGYQWSTWSTPNNGTKWTVTAYDKSASTPAPITFTVDWAK